MNNSQIEKHIKHWYIRRYIANIIEDYRRENNNNSDRINIYNTSIHWNYLYNLYKEKRPQLPEPTYFLLSFPDNIFYVYSILQDNTCETFYIGHRWYRDKYDIQYIELLESISKKI